MAATSAAPAAKFERRLTFSTSEPESALFERGVAQAALVAARTLR